MRNGLNTIQGIPIARTIIRRIKELVGSARRDITIIFPILLTRILRRHGVDFAGEVRRTSVGSDILTFGSLERMGYQNRNGVWVSRHRAQAAPSGQEDESEDEEAAYAAAASGDSATEHTETSGSAASPPHRRQRRASSSTSPSTRAPRQTLLQAVATSIQSFKREFRRTVDRLDRRMDTMDRLSQRMDAMESRLETIQIDVASIREGRASSPHPRAP